MSTLAAWLASAAVHAAEVVDVEQPFAAGIDLSGAMEGLVLTAGGLELKPADPTQPLQGRFESAAIAAPLAFTAVGPHWRARLPHGTSMTVELSTSADGLRWSRFHEVVADPHLVPAAQRADGTPNPYFGDTMGTLTHRSRGDGRYVRYRLLLNREAGVRETPQLQRLTLTFIDSARPGPLAEQPPVELREHAPRAGGYPKPPVNSRAAWGAEPPTCNYSYCTVTHITVHHTAGVGEYSCNGFSDCAADVRAIQAYHMDTNGWCDIGYNYLASSDGALWEGRGGGDDVRGAHDGFNCGSMGVSNMGYYHPPYDHVWTEAQLDAFAELSAWKADQKNIDPFGIGYYQGYGANMDNIYGHRDVKSTSCPGDTIYPRLDELRTRVADKLDGGGTELIYDNPAVDFLIGTWYTGTTAVDKYGSDYYWTDTDTADRRICGWEANLSAAGTYDVSFWWSQGSNRSPSVGLGLKQNQAYTFTVNQQVNGGRWNSMGSFFFTTGSVKLGMHNGGPDGYVVICDAVRFKKLN